MREGFARQAGGCLAKVIHLRSIAGGALRTTTRASTSPEGPLSITPVKPTCPLAYKLTPHALLSNARALESCRHAGAWHGTGSRQAVRVQNTCTFAGTALSICNTSGIFAFPRSPTVSCLTDCSALLDTDGLIINKLCRLMLVLFMVSQQPGTASTTTPCETTRVSATPW